MKKREGKKLRNKNETKVQLISLIAETSVSQNMDIAHCEWRTMLSTEQCFGLI